MSTKKHRIARIRRGRYNYRAYPVQRFGKLWAICDENGDAWPRSCRKTRREVCQFIDMVERGRN